MPYPKETLPIAERGKDIVKASYITQAGRSDSSLNAEQNLAEVRSDRSSPVSSPSVLDSSSSQSTLNLFETPASPPGISSGRRASHVPRIRSPLNPSTSTSSISSNGVHESDLSAGLGERQRSETSGKLKDGGAFSRWGSRPNSSLPPMRELSRQKSIKSIPDSRPQTLEHLKDLKRRYSQHPMIGQQSLKQSNYIRQPRPSSTTNLFQCRPSAMSLTVMNPSSEATLVGETGKRKLVDEMSNFNPCWGEGLILYDDEVEDDDNDHIPRGDDDFVFGPKFSDCFNRRVIVSTIGGIFLILGILSLFIVLPVIFFTGIARMQFPGVDYSYWPDTRPPITWSTVNDRKYSLLSNVRSGLIDPDTPESVKIRKSTFDGADLHLVFSDEFNQNNRTFYPGDDPYWTAQNMWYGATQDLDWYDPDAVTTYDGTLQLRLDRFSNHGLQYRSGMLNSWNQLCFKGGVFEVSLSLPGPSGVPGLWPGVWSMGNLGRPGYKATTEGVWPYTYDSCDLGITPNQSAPDGLSHLPGQKLPSCTCPGQDHPNPGTGRGAPEIDILEASVDPNNKIGVVTQSFQVAPFDIYYRPNSDFLQIPNYNTTSMNGYCGGPFQQAISGTTLLNNNWYDSNQYQKYAFEYEPGTSEGKIAWFVGEDRSFMMDGRAVGQNGNVAARVVSQEPMSLVLNLGFSTAWSEILNDQLRFPTIMSVDYVRIYQRPGSESITCDPPGYPTTDYIKNHAVAYNNPNLTAWNETGYEWPSNKMTLLC